MDMVSYEEEAFWFGSAGLCFFFGFFKDAQEVLVCCGGEIEEREGESWKLLNNGGG